MTDQRVLAEQALPGLLQDIVLESFDIDEFLDGVAKVAADTLSSAGREVLCGITLLRQRTKGTVASNNEQAQLMEEVQYPFDDGPCLRPAREGQVYVVKDFRNESRFGEYSSAIIDDGVRLALGVPVPLDGLAAAGSDLYSSQSNAFDEEAVAAAVRFGREAPKTLRHF